MGKMSESWYQLLLISCWVSLYAKFTFARWRQLAHLWPWIIWDKQRN